MPTISYVEGKIFLSLSAKFSIQLFSRTLQDNCFLLVSIDIAYVSFFGNRSHLKCNSNVIWYILILLTVCVAIVGTKAKNLNYYLLKLFVRSLEKFIHPRYFVSLDGISSLKKNQKLKFNGLTLS